MRVLKRIDDLEEYLIGGIEKFCLADTSFLYGMAYENDLLHMRSQEVFEKLVDHQVNIFTNVVSRLEFIDLIFRRQVTYGAVRLFECMRSSCFSPEIRPLFNLLKNIRDKESEAKKKRVSYNIDENRLKKLRRLCDELLPESDWIDFCDEFIGATFVNEWRFVEEDLGLNFVEVLEGKTSDYIESPVQWKDMVHLMGGQGLRGPDAMILNLFAKSRFGLLVSGDKDFEKYFAADSLAMSGKVLFLLENEI